MVFTRTGATCGRWLAGLTSIGISVFASACGSSGNNPGELGTTTGPDANWANVSCSTPQTGCPCTSEGETTACGTLISQSGNTVMCSEGKRTCADGSWGACKGEYVQARTFSTGIRVESLTLSASCGDKCDPSCQDFIDTSAGIDAGVDSGLTVNDAGISLTGVPLPPTTCSSLQITPNTAPTKDLVVTSLTPPSPYTVQYTAALQPPACYGGTPTFLWSIDKFDVAQISTSGQLQLFTPVAGPITVSAYAGSLSAAVVCNVTVNVVDTSAAPTGYSNTQFPTTTGATDNIAIIYPYSATVFPLGLPPPLIQWQNNNIPATTAGAVKVTLRFPSTGTPTFSWSEIVPELQTAPLASTTTAQPRATIPQNAWNDFQQSVVRNSGSTGGDAVIAVQRYLGTTTSGTLDGEVPITIHFANGQLKGNIFYNSYGTNLVQNFASTVKGNAFGAATLQVPVNGTSPTVVVGYADPTNSGAGCRVCHNVSADGSRVISNSYLTNGNSGGGSEATTFQYNATFATPAAIQGSQMLVGAYGSNVFTFAALSPDGTYLFSSAAPASAGGASKLYSLSGTAITSNVPASLGAATPAFSPDAQHIAFNYNSGNAKPLNTTISADGKSLAMMDFAAPATFSNFRILYTPGLNALYSVWPSFLPPGQNGVVFQNEIVYNGRDWAGTRSTCDGTGTCNNIGATAELWWVSTGTTPTATKLSNLNGGSYMPRLTTGVAMHGAYNAVTNPTYYEEVYNYEPAVLPVTIGGYSWVAFTSRRMYGNVATMNPYWSDPRFQDLSVQATTKKIWIAAIAPNPTPGTDPSYPAFYLPGQELLAGNARAYFSLAACEAPSTTPSSANLCTSNLDCCGSSATPPTAACQLDPLPLTTAHCVPVGSSACAADGAMCTTDGQCCNFATGSRCASGKCAPTPPILTYSAAPFVVNFTAVCGEETYPKWTELHWTSTDPTGTSIVFSVQTSLDGVTWGSPVTVATASPSAMAANVGGISPIGPSIDQDLRAAGQVSQAYLRLIATLTPNSTNTATPTLTAWTVKYDCAPSE